VVCPLLFSVEVTKPEDGAIAVAVVLPGEQHQDAEEGEAGAMRGDTIENSRNFRIGISDAG
jgi:hypothetical protein